MLPLVSIIYIYMYFFFFFFFLPSFFFFFFGLFLVQFPINLYSFSSRLTKAPFNAIISCWASCCPSQKERDKKIQRKTVDLFMIWKQSQLLLIFFYSTKTKPNQTKPVYDDFSLGSLWLRLRVYLVTGTIGLVPYIFVCVCVRAYALRFISFHSFMHVWCSGLTCDRTGLHWRQ